MSDEKLEVCARGLEKRRLISVCDYKEEFVVTTLYQRQILQRGGENVIPWMRQYDGTKLERVLPLEGIESGTWARLGLKLYGWRGRRYVESVSDESLNRFPKEGERSLRRVLCK